MRKYSILLIFLAAVYHYAGAQSIIYTQAFEESNRLFHDYVLANLDGATPADTNLKNLADSAWVVRQAGASGNHAAIATSSYTPASEADDWFITPSIRLGKAPKLHWESLSLTPGTSDTYEIFVSTSDQSVGGCLFNFKTAEYISSETEFTTHTLDLAAAGYKNEKVFIGFRLHTQVGGDKLAIDNIKVTDDSTTFVSLTFRVNMSKYIDSAWFNPATDTVDIAGTFNDWTGTNNILALEADSDSTIYSTTIGGFLEGDVLEFKFRVNSTWDDSIAEFPYGQPNRIWLVEPGKYVYTCYYNELGEAFGIDENASLAGVVVYPNPAENMVSIEFPEDFNYLRVINLAGKSIKELSLRNDNKVSLDLTNDAPGIYLLLFYNENGYIGCKKLIKK